MENVVALVSVEGTDKTFEIVETESGRFQFDNGCPHDTKEGAIEAAKFLLGCYANQPKSILGVLNYCNAALSGFGMDKTKDQVITMVRLAIKELEDEE